MMNFSEVQQRLDTSLGEFSAGNYGAFWRGKTRDAFVALEIFGLRVAVPGEPAQSALVNALRGNPPFGPSAASREDIELISNWIAQGCPDARTPMMAERTAAAGVRVNDEAHVRYWRSVDYFFLPSVASPETRPHVGRLHMPAFFAWKASKLLGQGAKVWDDYMKDSLVQESFRYLRLHQTRLIEDAYGMSQENLFDSLWKFGGNLLPPDPQIEIPSQRTMNSPYDWFFWAPYTEMSLRASDASDADLRLARAWQVGIAADGLIRNRLEIPDFDKNDVNVDQTVKTAFHDLQKDALISGMIARAVGFASSPVFEGWP